jgi:hypothetical protein
VSPTKPKKTKRSTKHPTSKKTKVSMDTPNKVEKLEAQPAVITSYKGFDSNWQCRGFQYAIGGEYTHTGDVKACSSGFHACEYPLDVFGYYPPTGSKFATVEQSGKFARDGGDSKVASSRLKVVAELSLAGIIKAAIEYPFSRSKPEGETATGTRGAASATGNQGAASATGKDSVAMSSGWRGQAKAADGCALFLVFRDDNYKIVHAWAGIAGRDGVKADTWYVLDAAGKPAEVTP